MANEEEGELEVYEHAIERQGRVLASETTKSRELGQRATVPQAYCYGCDEAFHFIEDVARHMRDYPGHEVRSTFDGRLMSRRGEHPTHKRGRA